MDWIEHGHALLLTMASSQASKMRNGASAMEHQKFISGAVSEMLAEGFVTMLPPGKKPMVVSPSGVVPKCGKPYKPLNFDLDAPSS